MTETEREALKLLIRYAWNLPRKKADETAARKLVISRLGLKLKPNSCKARGDAIMAFLKT